MSLFKPLGEKDKVDFAGCAPFDGLQDIQAAFADLDIGHVGLWTPQSLAERGLRQASFNADIAQQRKNRTIGCLVNAFLGAPHEGVLRVRRHDVACIMLT